MSADDSLRNLLGHPAFAGFARLLLPWDGRRYDEAMRLSDIGSLLPYHSHVDPGAVVGALNRMIDDVNSGYRKYKNLGHGFGPGTGTSAEGWIAEAVRFWETLIAQRN